MYCSYCAASIDSSQTFCARCGRPVGTAATPPPPATLTVGGRPSGVKIAFVLLLLCCAVSLVTSIQILFVYKAAQSAVYMTRTFSFLILWLVSIVFLWQRQGWARIVILLLTLWSTGNVVFSLIRFANANANGVVWSLLFSLAMDGIRLVAVYLTFRPESNAWFKK